MTLLNILLRAYLFTGLAAHKVVWEVMKRGQGAPKPEPGAPVPQSLSLMVVKAGKIAVLVGLFVQLFLPVVLPITDHPHGLRIAGAIIFTFGLLIAVLARVALGKNWSDIEVGSIQREHMLVNQGVYKYVRHPIYTGDLAMLIGLELCLNSWLVLGVAAIAIPTALRAVREEKVLAKSVTGYELYCQQTKRFIPFVI
jgi:protein-S-isoprenylcysteine O-methyltransferase Ste14